jgi:hypothetical protein
VIACLKEIYAIRADEIDYTMLLSKSAGPRAGSKVFQRFGLPDTREWISQNGFNQIEGPKCDLAFRLNPVSQVLAKLQVKHGISRMFCCVLRLMFLWQCPFPGEALPGSLASCGGPTRDSTP